jgi:hypothetical protein
MAKVTVKRNVVLRAIVTEQLKQDLQDEMQRAAEEIDQRLAQIEFQTKPYITELQRTNLQQAMQVRKQVDAEKRKQQDIREALVERRAQVAKLELGAEVVRGTLESFVEIKEGDDLAELLGGVEIVTKDERVIAIRQRTRQEIAQDDELAQIMAAGLDGTE